MIEISISTAELAGQFFAFWIALWFLSVLARFGDDLTAKTEAIALIITGLISYAIVYGSLHVVFVP